MDAALIKLALYAAALGAAGLAFNAAAVLASPQEARPWLRVAAGLGLVALLVAAMRLALETARLAGGWGAIGEPPYLDWTLRAQAPFLAALGPGLLLLAVAGCLGRRRLAAAGGLLTLAAFPMVGHTSGEPLMWLLRAAVVAHLVGVAAWLAAPAVLWPRRALEDAAVLARVRRFSGLALSLVPLALAAGALTALALLERPADLIATAYGRLILVKVVAATLALGLGALNKTWVTTRLAADPGRGRGALRLTLAADAALFATALAAIAAATTVYGL